MDAKAALMENANVFGMFLLYYWLTTRLSHWPLAGEHAYKISQAIAGLLAQPTWLLAQ